MYFDVDAVQDHSIASMNKSVENLLISSHEVISSINSSSLGGQSSSGSLGNGVSSEQQDQSNTGRNERSSPISSPSSSPRPSPKSHSKRKKHHPDSLHLPHRELNNHNKFEDPQMLVKVNFETTNRSSDSAEHNKNTSHDGKREGKSNDRAKKKSSWYNVLYPTYKSRSEDFKRIFKDVPDDERLVVDYSCALQREILVHGRLYVSQNYVCFYANIFMWETLVSLRWKDVTSITKEKTALVIPNAILISTENDKFFLTSFATRDKTYLMLFRVWQNALIGQPMSMAEMWQLVHTSYGDELGLTSDDEDYIPPLPPQHEEKLSSHLSVESFSETELITQENVVTSAADPAADHSAPEQIRNEVALDPTDFSDTTESEAEKQALRIQRSALCTASHEGRQINSATLPIHIDQLFTLLFTNSKFFLDFHTARKTTDLVQSAWTHNNETGQKMRTISLTVSLTQAVGPRSSQVTETQIMLPCSKPGHLYSIDVESINAGIPYADSFSIQTHYCLRSISDSETNLTVYSQIKYKKSVWALAKSFIDKNCWAGLEEYFSSLIKAIRVECEESSTVTGGLKRKTRRRRRGTTTTIGLPTASPELLTSNPIAAADASYTHISNAPGVRGDAGVVSWVLLVAVLCLLLINGLLYYKLWGLEEAASYTIMDLHVLKNTPKTEEDWINLLQHQENLHNVEMKRWQRILHTATQLLRQTEESLTELQMSIHPTATEKQFSVLKSRLKPLNSHSDQRNNAEL